MHEKLREFACDQCSYKADKLRIHCKMLINCRFADCIFSYSCNVLLWTLLNHKESLHNPSKQYVSCPYDNCKVLLRPGSLKNGIENIISIQNSLYNNYHYFPSLFSELILKRMERKQLSHAVFARKHFTTDTPWKNTSNLFIMKPKDTNVQLKAATFLVNDYQIYENTKLHILIVQNNAVRSAVRNLFQYVD